ncbi:MAG: DUF5683 domain-containing protein [Prevotellaceae bacterium]|jgi:hypothetical protein|nr:DUF5683 domain-containing protein [Prevotellaceae bacterium]
MKKVLLPFFCFMYILSVSAQQVVPRDTIAVRSALNGGSVKADTLPDIAGAATALPQVFFKPDANKSVWYALLFPGLGQFYNRRYWKIPIVYGGFAGLAYGISWNGRYYNDYLQGYRDMADDDPDTKSYEKLLPKGYSGSDATSFLKQRQNSFRRSRDLAIIGAVAFYAITVIDAFVDAQLADFDISPDLSMRLAPSVTIPDNSNIALGMQVQIHF